jgi:transposase
MSFCFYPEHQYGCANVNHCPHLGGAALGNVVFEANENYEFRNALFRQLDGYREENAAQSRQIEELKAQLEQAKAELKAERQKQFQTTKDTPDATFDSVEPEDRPKKKLGAPVGHPGWFRPTPTEFDRLLLVPAPERCPGCGWPVKSRPDLDPYDHLLEDLIDGRPTVTCYRHELGRCTNPQCRLWAQQPGEGEILRAKIGPQMRARGIFLRFKIGLPYRRVVETAIALDSISFSPAALLGFEKQAGQRAKPLAADVKNKLRACDVNHADETYYRVGKERGIAWFHGNEHLAHFYICGTRSGKITRAILGPDYAGDLVTDCYAGYDRSPAKAKQKCLEHVKRTAQDWLKITPEKATAARQFFQDVAAWAKRGCRWHRRWRKDPELDQQEETAWLREEQARLEGVELDSDKARTLQERIRRYSKEWLTFLRDPRVPPTNNLAEQAIRFLVILRKVTYGSRTRAGARRMGVLLTVIHTCKRQGRDIIQFLVALFTLTPNEAARAMYARK